MSERDDGGPAFPTDEDTYDYQGRRDAARLGMTLRDWFAGQALTGVLASLPDTGHAVNCDSLAAFSYSMADAMLEARKK